MGLVQNLKKIWKIMEQGYSDGLSSPSTKQKEKPISKKPDNSLSTESSQKALTQENQRSIIATSSTDTSERITMNAKIEPVAQIRNWSIERIHELAEGNIESQFDAVAIAEEFDEWINLPVGKNELEYLCLENEDFGDKEVDTL
jgi:hypothetical protein